MKLTERQDVVMQNLSLVKTDGARVDPQFRLGDKNVSLQVRSLIERGLVELRGASLMVVEPPASPAAAVINTDAAVSAMRDFLSERIRER